MADTSLNHMIDAVEEQIKQARKKLEDLEKRLQIAHEKFLKRLEKEQ